MALLADPAVAAWASRISPGWLSLAWPVTALGNSTYMLVGSALAAAVAARGWRRADTPAGRALLVRGLDRSLFFFGAIALSGLAAQLAKHVVGRGRPQAAGVLGAFTLHPFSLDSAFASFPSGHTTSAFAAATALGVMLPRGRVALFALAIAIGVSRVVLREHYPSDVVGGAALGILVTLALARAPAASRAVPAWWAWIRRRRAAPRPVQPARGRALAIVATFFTRHRAAPALAAGLFAIAVPPTDLFGSEMLENIKDGGALVLALAGLTVRALVVGFGQAPGRGPGPGRPAELMTRGLYGVCRHPLYAGNVMILTAIMLMHGNRWTVLLGSATTLLIHGLMAQAEDDQLLRTFGPTYAAYGRRVPRWWPGLDRLRMALDGQQPFDLRRVLHREYPIIGTTIVALAAAEFYEEVQEPWVGGQVLYLQGLATIILGVSLGMGVVWLAKRRWLTGSP